MNAMMQSARPLTTTDKRSNEPSSLTAKVGHISANLAKSFEMLEMIEGAIFGPMPVGACSEMPVQGLSGELDSQAERSASLAARLESLAAAVARES